MKTKNVTTKMKLFIMALCMVLGLSFVSSPMTVCAAGASESGSGYDLGWLGAEGNGAFDEMESTVQETGNSAYKLFMAIAVVCLVICLIIVGISIAFGGSGQGRANSLKWLLWVCIGGVVVFGALSFITMFQNIGTNLM